MPATAKVLEMPREIASPFDDGLCYSLSAVKCTHCRGIGKLLSGATCKCVYRAVFRICFNRFRECQATERCSLEYGCVRDSATSWGRRNEEYSADFLGVAKRTLKAAEWKVFRLHTAGADWQLGTRITGFDKAGFFRLLYRAQEKLGQKFAQLQPYALFPLNEYFSKPTRGKAPAPVIPITAARRSLAAIIPLRAAA